jgi:NhaP-type Na+/H+ and K+/H+ antiporter
MQLSDLSFNPSSRTLRQFAAIWILFFVGLATWQGVAQHRRALAEVLACVGIVVGSLGLWQPRFMQPIYVGWMIAAFPIGWTVSRLSLAAIFFLVAAPLGSLSRLAGRDRLGLRRPSGKSSHWSPLDEPPDVRRYFRQY